MSEIIRRGTDLPSTGNFKDDRTVAKARRQTEVQHRIDRYQVEKETRLAAYKTDGLAAFTGNAMERLVEVDMMRRALAGDDQGLNELLARLEVNFEHRVEGIQNRLFNDFGL